MAVKKKPAPQIKFWTPLRIVSLLIVLVLLGAFGVSRCTSEVPNRTAFLAAVPAVVFDTEMKAANGNSIKLSNYSGKVLFVNLWATWCGPCRMETPELVKLHKQYQSRGVEFIGPEKGMLSCGYEGLGRLWSVDDIAARALKLMR